MGHGLRGSFLPKYEHELTHNQPLWVNLILEQQDLGTIRFLSNYENESTHNQLLWVSLI